jgi:hypothetical protein
MGIFRLICVILPILYLNYEIKILGVVKFLWQKQYDIIVKIKIKAKGLPLWSSKDTYKQIFINTTVKEKI